MKLTFYFLNSLSHPFQRPFRGKFDLGNTTDNRPWFLNPSSKLPVTWIFVPFFPTSSYRRTFKKVDEIYLAEWLERLSANAKVATVLGPESSDTVESEGRQMKQCWTQYIYSTYCSKKSKKISLLKKITSDIGGHYREGVD